MPNDFKPFLWLLKLGALLNLWLLAGTFASGAGAADPHIIVPARILFAVSAYRCLFPNRYKDNVVLHDTILSSTFVTRVLATFAELAFIYLLSHVIRLLNVDEVGQVDALSWVMVAAVSISQGFVWGAIATGRLRLYFYEEIGWANIFVANTIASAWLYLTVDSLGAGETLLQLNLLFGLFYLPWQAVHLRSLLVDARSREATDEAQERVSSQLISSCLGRSIHETNRSTSAEDWGGLVGLTWMTAYWATLIPLWVHRIVVTVGAGPG